MESKMTRNNLDDLLVGKYKSEFIDYWIKIGNKVIKGNIC